MVPLWHANEHVFVSKRVGFNNAAGIGLNFGVVCLKR